MIREMVYIYNKGFYAKEIAATKERKSGVLKQWQKAHRQYFSDYNKRDYVREKDSAAKRKRRAVIRESQYELTDADWAECLEYFDHKCAYCGSEVNIVQDHFLPISKYRNHSKYNIVPCCRSCNSSKSNHDYFVWHPQQPFYDPMQKLKIVAYVMREFREEPPVITAMKRVGE